VKVEARPKPWGKGDGGRCRTRERRPLWQHLRWSWLQRRLPRPGSSHPSCAAGSHSHMRGGAPSGLHRSVPQRAKHRRCPH
jgi:hypothetical protein